MLSFFSSFSVDDECLSDDGRRAGMCMNVYECRLQGGYFGNILGVIQKLRNTKKIRIFMFFFFINIYNVLTFFK